MSWKLRSTLVVGLMTAVSAHAGDFLLAADTFLQGAWFAAGTNLVTMDVSGTPMPLRGRLAFNYASRDIVWAKGNDIKFDGQMNVLEGSVSVGSVFSQSLLPTSLASFFRSGGPAQVTFLNPITIANYQVDIPAKTAVTFHEDGSIRVASIGGSIRFVGSNGRMYNLAKTAPDIAQGNPTQFWPSQAPTSAGTFKLGQVRRGNLFGDHLHLVDVFPGGSTVGFDAGGELDFLECRAKCIYKRITMPGGGTVEILPSGMFTMIGNQAITVGARTYPAFQRLLLTPEGAVIAAAAPQ